MKSATIFFAAVTLAVFSSPILSQSNVVKVFECGVEGCDIVCITKSRGVIQVNAARKVTMSVHPDGLTIYDADLGLGEKETIITGDGGVCKISHRE